MRRPPLDCTRARECGCMLRILQPTSVPWCAQPERGCLCCVLCAVRDVSMQLCQTFGALRFVRRSVAAQLIQSLAL